MHTLHVRAPAEGLAAIASARGAPLPQLLAQARRAAGDEVRHARAAAALARRFGALPGEWSERPKITPLSGALPRSHRARERDRGCVQETWGALTGLWAAERAEDPEIRRTLGEHAPDELRHAELAWSVAAWIRDLLDDDAALQERLWLQHA